MIKSIISKFLIVLITAFAVFSIFWFFKTSAVRKQVLALISSSGGKVSAASVSVGGFPLQQKIAIDDLKVQLSLSNPLPNLPTDLVWNDKYQIQIKKLEASASIFSSDFVINNFEEVSFADQAGVVSSIQFNQPPQSNFVVVDGELTKFSYQDSGYKILDAGKNILFENGSSLVSFESVVEGDKYRNKIKADFKDVGTFGVNNAVATNLTTNPIAEPVAPAIDAPKDPNTAATPVAAVPEVVNPVASAPVAGNLVKKSFLLDLEYVVVKPSVAVSTPPVDPTPDAKTATTEAVPADAINEKSIESLTIKNFEVSSPLYKLTVNGEINSFSNDKMPLGNISFRIEKLDNIIVHIKKFFAGNSDINSTKVENNVVNAPVGNVPAVVAETNVAVPNPNPETVPAAVQTPDSDISAIIKNLSRKNAATNEEVAVFDFRQEKGKDLLINETAFPEIMGQISAAQGVNNATNIDPAAPVSTTALPTTSAAVAAPATAAAPTPATIPTPAKIAIPAKPANAN